MYNLTEQKEIAKVFDFLAIAYGEKSNLDRIKAYMTIFYRAGLTPTEIAAGAELHAGDTSRAGTFYPKAADIIRQAQGSGDDQGTKAWYTLKDASCKPGMSSHVPVSFDDGKINYVVNSMGGMAVFITASADEKHWLMKEFLQCYKIAGIDEVCKPSAKLDLPTIYIGDKDKCLALKSSGRKAITQDNLVKQLADKKKVV